MQQLKQKLKLKITQLNFINDKSPKILHINSQSKIHIIIHLKLYRYVLKYELAYHKKLMFQFLSILIEIKNDITEIVNNETMVFYHVMCNTT